MNDKEQSDSRAFVQAMEEKGLGWQYHGPVLRNSGGMRVEKHYWSLFEAIVWIATRDKQAVAGAAGLLEEGDPEDVSIHAQVVVGTTLPRDVAGHHLDCVSRDDGLRCNCDDLMRVRYCRCADRYTNTHHSCPCTNASIISLFDRLHSDLGLSGRLKGEEGFKRVPSEAFAGATLAYTQTGVGLLKEYAELKVARCDIERMWPEDFSDRPLPSAAPQRSPQQKMLSELDEYALQGRPSAKLVGLKLFCDRLGQGAVKKINDDEAGAVVACFPKKVKDRDPDIPTKKVVRGWISKLHQQLVWVDGKPENAGAVAQAVMADMRAIIDAKKQVQAANFNLAGFADRLML